MLHMAPRVTPATRETGWCAWDHTCIKTHALYGLDAQRQQLQLLLPWQQRRAVGAGFVEVRLDRRPVIRDCTVYRLFPGQHEVHIHLGAIEVLLHHDGQIHPTTGIAVRAKLFLTRLDQRPSHDTSALEVTHHPARSFRSAWDGYSGADYCDSWRPVSYSHWHGCAGSSSIEPGAPALCYPIGGGMKQVQV